MGGFEPEERGEYLWGEDLGKSWNALGTERGLGGEGGGAGQLKRWVPPPLLFGRIQFENGRPTFIKKCGIKEYCKFEKPS